jgi:hypothetical protein
LILKPLAAVPAAMGIAGDRTSAGRDLYAADLIFGAPDR